MFYLRAFGRTIESELAFPEFEPIDPGEGRSAPLPDLRIARVALPPIPPEARNAGMFRVHDGVIEFEVSGIVRVRVASAERIEVELLDPAREREARLFVTGSAFGAWTYLTGRFPFHCGLVTHKGAGIAITGPSGAGKSTLTTALMKRGLGFMSDDVVVIEPGGHGRVEVTASFPRIKLWQDAADHFAIETAELSQLHCELEKFHVPFPPDKIVERAPLRAVFRLRFDEESAAVTCRPLPLHEALLELRANLYRPQLVGALGLEEAAFALLTGMLAHVPVYDLARPRDFACFDATITAMLDRIAQVDTGE